MTEDQQALVDAEESLFAAACPGAGKTRAMVARFLKRTAEENRQGVALISFTNAAVDEVRHRCGDQIDALKVPNFVGTFDAFIHRFIVTSLFVREYKVPPKYVQSWKEISSTSFRMSEIPRSGELQFSWFDFDRNGRATLVMDRVDRRFGNAEAKTALSAIRHKVESRASYIFGKLLEAGTVSCDAARLLAEFWLQDSEARQVLGPLLQSRFSEVIVDEAQDCGREELLVLQYLLECGIRVVMVGDIDQSIYEFRNATPSAVQEFVKNLPVQLELGDNFRSSPAICAFNGGLRSGTLTETSRGATSTLQVPVHLIEFSALDDIVPTALQIAENQELVAGDLMLLSHAEAHGMKAAGVVDAEASGSNRVLAIADAGFKLRSKEFDARTRFKSIEQVERAVLTALTSGKDSGHKSFEAICEKLGLETRWLRNFAVRMAVALDAEGKTRQGFATEVRDFLKDANWGDLNPPVSGDLGGLFRAPKEDVWANVASLGDDPLIPYSTVHGVKGMEFPGVVLVLPDTPRSKATEEVLDAWESSQDIESRRVLYVAGSRAQKLLVFAVHRKHIDRVAALLDAKAVPYVRS
ncbi:UvrD-helicase domain-containing protein [Streptomyces sp. NBC_01439]|uniref:UvrD-helicase domain-containing protein n=1 Tax=Streptomyces sp. NBC_01439 TaxID=2903867 RepID=UPI002E27F30C|nr:UvrD-helicase domain-containing protein [Streptomyces sp. NBC_01439]